MTAPIAANLAGVTKAKAQGALAALRCGGCEPRASARAGARFEPRARPFRPPGESAIDIGPRLGSRGASPAAVDSLGEQHVGLGVTDIALDHGGCEESSGLGVERAVAGGMR